MHGKVIGAIPNMAKLSETYFARWAAMYNLNVVFSPPQLKKENKLCDLSLTAIGVSGVILMLIPCPLGSFHMDKNKKKNKARPSCVILGPY